MCSQPGKSTQNGYVERFSGSVRKELLNAFVFSSLSEVQEKVQEWMDDYNEYRPYKVMGYKSPRMVLNEKQNSENSHFSGQILMEADKTKQLNNKN